LLEPGLHVLVFDDDERRRGFHADAPGEVAVCVSWLMRRIWKVSWFRRRCRTWARKPSTRRDCPERSP